LLGKRADYIPFGFRDKPHLMLTGFRHYHLTIY